jgi:hypothetical protein
MELLTKREIAAEVLEAAFRTRRRVPIAELVEMAAKRGVSRRTLTRAARSAGLHVVQNGPNGGFWEKP